MTDSTTAVIDRAGLGRLVEVLCADGYRVIGPRVRDGAIVLDELNSDAQLPAGWGAQSEPGRYRLCRRADDAVVCPTCFCTTTEEVTDLTGDHTERWERWASCFELDFSYLHGGSVRQSGVGRYRQWLSHKLSTWYEQFGSSGCVGCGRCIAWCPAGIDLTAEVASLAEWAQGADDDNR